MSTTDRSLEVRVDRIESDVTELRAENRLVTTAILGGFDGSPPGIHKRIDRVMDDVAEVRQVQESWDRKITSATDTVKNAALKGVLYFGRFLGVGVGIEMLRLVATWWPGIANFFTAAASSLHPGGR